MGTSELRGFIEEQEQLPTFSPVAIALVDEITREDLDPGRLVELIRSDPSLASRILRAANTLDAGRRLQVGSVEEALELLGSEGLRSLSLPVVAFQLYDSPGEEEHLWVAFWQHNLACAVAAELLARRLSYPSPEEAYMAGLLHDVGKLLLLHWDPSGYQKVLGCARKQSLRLLEAEEAELGMGHTQAGKLLLEHWRLPASLVLSAWLHHQPLSEFGSNPLERLPFVVKCADSLCHQLGWGVGTVRVELDEEQLCHFTGIGLQEIHSIGEEVTGRVGRTSDRFPWREANRERLFSSLTRSNQELSRVQVKFLKGQRQLRLHERLTGSLKRFQESLAAPSTPGRILERIVELLSETVPHRRLMGFVPLRRDNLIEGRVRVASQNYVRRIRFPLQRNPTENLPAVAPREQIALIEEAAQKAEASFPEARLVREALANPELVVLPLESDARTLGHILIEPEGVEWNTQDTAGMLRQYSWATALALERALLAADLDQRAEDLARMARRSQEFQVRLSRAERLASVGRLAAGAAHEIKNPLAIISAWAQVLRGQVGEPKQKEALERIIDQTVRISKIVGDLIGLARPGAPHLGPALITEILDSCLETLESRIKVSGIEVRKDYAPDLPYLHVDARQIEQVFLNLVVNALQAMGNGGVLSLRAVLDPGQGFVQVEIADTGRGIPAQELPLIFDPFYSTKRVGEGTGLGLSICHSIVQNHGGRIEVSSRPGEGTVFRLLLPVGEHQETPIEPETGDVDRVPDEAEEVENPNRFAVLVVDDEDALRTVLAEYLARNGFEVDMAGDGDEALEKLSGESYSVLLLDLRMPGKSGLEVLSEVRREQPRLPVIVLSGVADEKSFDLARRLGAFACVRKPFQLKEVLELARKAVQDLKP